MNREKLFGLILAIAGIMLGIFPILNDLGPEELIKVAVVLLIIIVLAEIWQLLPSKPS